MIFRRNDHSHKANKTIKEILKTFKFHFFFNATIFSLDFYEFCSLLRY